jgi:D-glycero-alpha-D-manno-heptose-7-phosphate kinase
MADIPAGTGLGSSGSFTTALLKALHAYQKNLVHPDELAAQACEIEIDRLGEPLGKQDQYISAFGGVTCFRFHQDERVEAWPLRASAETLHSLEDNLMLFFTGFTRSASCLLKDQDDKTKNKNSQMLKNMEFVKELGVRSLEAIQSGDLHTFAELMNVHWEHKRGRTKGMSNDCIDLWYGIARKNGALGGKLIGAGGGGFLLFYTEDHRRLRRAMTQCGVREVRFRFDFEGTKALIT